MWATSDWIIIIHLTFLRTHKLTLLNKSNSYPLHKKWMNKQKKDSFVCLFLLVSNLCNLFILHKSIHKPLFLYNFTHNLINGCNIFRKPWILTQSNLKCLTKWLRYKLMNNWLVINYYLLCSLICVKVKTGWNIVLN